MEVAKRKCRCQRIKDNIKKLRPKRKPEQNNNRSNDASTSGESSIPPPPPTSDIHGGIPECSEAPDTGDSVSDEIVGLPKCQDSEGSNVTEEASPATIDLPLAGEEKLLKDMSERGHHEIVKLLQPKCTLGNDYRMLASKMGYKQEYIKYLESLREPVKELIMEYGKDGKTIAELVSLLEKMDRQDVVEDLQEYIEATPTPKKIEEREQRRRISDELRTMRDSYHAFICYDEEDKAFVEELVKKTEGDPHHLNLCCPQRDFLPGGSRFETTAMAIEQRCSKFIVVLSTNFDGSLGARYEAHIAMSLAPGVKEKRIIPVLIDEAYRTKIPRTISHITYLDYIRQSEDDFWKMLCDSLTSDY